MMKSVLGFLYLLIVGTGVNGQSSNDSIYMDFYQEGPKGISYPVIKWDADTFDIGELYPGDVLEFELGFTNAGYADLNIEVATACKCIDMDWPREPVPPQYSSKILVVFDSKGMDTGDHIKTIDIVANTNPIVVEGKVKMKIVPRPE